MMSTHVSRKLRRGVNALVLATLGVGSSLSGHLRTGGGGGITPKSNEEPDDRLCHTHGGSPDTNLSQCWGLAVFWTKGVQVSASTPGFSSKLTSLSSPPSILAASSSSDWIPLPGFQSIRLWPKPKSMSSMAILSNMNNKA